MNAGAVIAAQQRKAVAAFRQHACTSPESARPLEELNVRRNFAIRALIRRGVFLEVDSNRYWLDEEAWESLCAQRRKLVLWLLVAMAITIAILLLNQE